jgi:tRNA (mo5U34)-methyltransferase
MTLQSAGAVDAEIRSFAPWFHNLHLPDGRQTAPDHPLGDFPAFKWEQIAGHLPDDLSGVSALDIGCNAGFYSFALAARGAHVTAIDHDPHYLRQAEWARAEFGLGEEQVRLVQMGVYDLARSSEAFDLVLFLGVLYHLRYPLLALDIVAQRARGMLVVQTLTMPGGDAVTAPADLSLGERGRMLEPAWPKMAFIEHSLEGDPTNWWAPNQACVEAMLRSSGFDPVCSPGHEIVIARRSGNVSAPADLRALGG